MSDEDDRKAILRAIRRNRRKLETNAATRAALYSERMALYERARALDSAITHRELAEAAGVTEVAVTVALRKRANALEAAG